MSKMHKTIKFTGFTQGRGKMEIRKDSLLRVRASENLIKKSNLFFYLSSGLSCIARCSLTLKHKFCWNEKLAWPHLPFLIKNGTGNGTDTKGRWTVLDWGGEVTPSPSPRGSPDARGESVLMGTTLGDDIRRMVGCEVVRREPCREEDDRQLNKPQLWDRVSLWSFFV